MGIIPRFTVFCETFFSNRPLLSAPHKPHIAGLLTAPKIAGLLMSPAIIVERGNQVGRGSLTRFPSFTYALTIADPQAFSKELARRFGLISLEEIDARIDATLQRSAVKMYDALSALGMLP